MMSNTRVMEQPVVRSRKGKISVACSYRNRFIPGFLAAVAVLTVLSLLYLDIDWLKLASRVRRSERCSGNWYTLISRTWM